MTRPSTLPVRVAGSLVALGLARVLSFAEPAVTPESSLPVLNPNDTAFPQSSLADFSRALDAPAGKHGFLFIGSDGRLYFDDGTRERFWGINVAKDAVFVPHETIDQVADCFASAGLNLVRLHHVDGVTGLLPADRAGSEERIDPEKLDALFYWVHALKQRGIYVYLDLMDFRTFQEAEGVVEAEALGRGAKPAAVFNERLIELQLEYARALLFERSNPYTDLALGADPAVAMVELCDENGLFRRLKRLQEVPEVYREELRRRWNFWLRSEYGSTPELARAWARGDGRAALTPTESIEEATVRFLPPSPDRPDFPSPTGGGLPAVSTPSRERDLVRFCASVHLAYFIQMRDSLREMGLRVPLTAVTDWDNLADLRCVAESLDFVGCNWYYDHPVFSAGREWRLPSFFTNANPVADEQGLDFTSSVARAAVSGKPLVVREWGGCWPSKFRGVSLLEAAAYATLQDIDAMILFTYNTQPDVGRIEYFDVSSDPVRWGLAALAGRVYRDRLISPAHKRVRLASSREDMLESPSPDADGLLRLSWVSQLRQLLFNDTCDATDHDLVIAAGTSGQATFSGERVFFPGAATADTMQRSGYNLTLRPGGPGPFTLAGIGYQADVPIGLLPGPRFAVSDLEAAGLQPLGLGADGVLACGFFDPSRANCGLLDMGPDGALRVALDLLGGGDEQPFAPSHSQVEQQEYVSDTGEIRRAVTDERLVIDTPRVQALAGALSTEPVSTSDMVISTPSSLGVVAAVSLDERPLVGPGPILLKMTTVAVNQGETKGAREAPPGSPQFQLDAFGDAPVNTHGKQSDAPTMVHLGGETVLSAFMVNGTWEAVRKGRGWYVWCDTPGTRFSLPPLGEKVDVIPFDAEGAGDAIQSSQPFTYPPRCRFVRVVPSSA